MVVYPGTPQIMSFKIFKLWNTVQIKTPFFLLRVKYNGRVANNSFFKFNRDFIIPRNILGIILQNSLVFFKQLNFRYTHKEKARGIKSGDRAGMRIAHFEWSL